MEIIEFIDNLDIDDRFKAYLYSEGPITLEELKEFWEDCEIINDVEIKSPHSPYGVTIVTPYEADGMVEDYIDEIIYELKSDTKHAYDWLLAYIDLDKAGQDMSFDELYDAKEISWEDNWYWCYDS